MSEVTYLGDRIPRGHSLSPALEPPDLAIEIPNFNIAAVDELARGPQGLRVAVGVDRPVRGNTIVSIDQVGPVGQHGALPSAQDNDKTTTRQRAGNEPGGAGSHAGAEWNPILMSETGRKPLRHKGIIEFGIRAPAR